MSHKIDGTLEHEQRWEQLKAIVITTTLNSLL